MPQVTKVVRDAEGQVFGHMIALNDGGEVFGDKSQPFATQKKGTSTCCAGFDVINTQIKLKLNITEASATKLNKLNLKTYIYIYIYLNESNKLQKHRKWNTINWKY